MLMQTVDAKFKDRNPFETIEIVRNTLADLEIMVTETWITTNMGLYTVRLEIDNTRFGVNGKGTSKVYALASAYGEFMERLQNLTYFKLQTLFLHRDPRLYRNQKRRPIDEFPALAENILAKMPAGTDYAYAVENMMQYARVKFASDQMRCFVFVDASSGETLDVPIELLNYYYGSNGMAAGNTKSETYVQGLSEVLERYAARRCMVEGLTPPDLDAGLLQSLANYGDIHRWTERIESTGRYQIRLVDMSLGLGIPVVGIILFDLEMASYFIKVGAHPSLEIAVERCFTELLQGRNIEHFDGMIPFSDSIELLGDDENLFNYFTDGQGAFPVSFFGPCASWQPTLENRALMSNAQMESHLIALIESMGYRVFVYDCTATQIHTYHFLVPGMSEIAPAGDRGLTRIIRGFAVGELIAQNIEQLSGDEAQTILDYLSDYDIDGEAGVQLLIKHLDFKSPNLYKDTCISVFKACLYLLVKDYDGALNSLRDYQASLKKFNKMSAYIDCYISFLTLYIDQDDIDAIRFVLAQFYEAAVVQNVIDDFLGYPLKDFKAIHCDYRCSDCRWQDSCQIKDAKVVYDKITDVMASGLV